MPLPDGRTLGYALAGAPQGEPVVTFHGLPGSRMESLLFHQAAEKLNLRIITADRPGYGLSTPKPQRTLLQCSDDVACLADHLGLASFNMIGVSGGAPCALACGARIARRIKKLAIVCGLGPLYHTGLTRAMRTPTAMSLWLAHHLPMLMKILVGVPVLATAKFSPQLLLNIIGLFNGGADKILLADSQVRKILDLTIREAFRQGMIGAVTDMQLYTQPWGFQLKDITMPVELWHGDNDKVVPLSHGQYVYDHLTDSQLTVVPGEGHFSLPIRCAEQILQPFT